MTEEVDGTPKVEVQLTEERQAEILKLEEQKLLAEKQSETLTAQKNLLDAQKDLQQAQLEGSQWSRFASALPDASVTKPSGEISTDEKFGYLAELVAFQSMRRAAKGIGERIKNLAGMPEKTKILVVNSLDFATGDFPRLQLKSMFDFYERLLSEQFEVNRSLLEADVEAVETVPTPPGMVEEEWAGVVPIAGALPVALSLLSATPKLIWPGLNGLPRCWRARASPQFTSTGIFLPLPPIPPETLTSSGRCMKPWKQRAALWPFFLLIT